MEEGKEDKEEEVEDVVGKEGVGEKVANEESEREEVNRGVQVDEDLSEGEGQGEGRG